jgi:starvation-inducible outer membrane lipoprotein
MDYPMKQKWPVILVLLLFISALACTSVLTEQVRSTADEETLFEEIFEDPNQHLGKIIILGGEIVRIQYKGQTTEVEFAEIPLYRGGKPALGFDPGEHFFMIFPERIDETLLKKGKVLTIAGRVIGTRNLRGFDYPLFAYEEAYVWDKLRQDRFPSYGVFLQSS